MPKLTSGRCVGVEVTPLAKHASEGADEHIYAFIVDYRLKIQQPSDLRNLLAVLYYKDSLDEPPKAPSYRSGHLVQDVLAGRADWSPSEIEEFKTWLETDRAVNVCMTEQFDAINAAIRNSPVWKSDFMLDD